MHSIDWLPLAQRLQALAQNGLAYCQNEYDRQRYEEIYSLSLQMLANLSHVPVEAMIHLLPSEVGYQTPKVDIRAVVLQEGTGQVLMVQEKIDQNRWTLPGGWAEVGYTPFEMAQKEVEEETGLQVKALRLLAVFDKKNHAHPPQPWYVYKFFILCQVTNGWLRSETIETQGIAWINPPVLDSLPLSTDRVTTAQLTTVLRLAANEFLPALCD